MASTIAARTQKTGDESDREKNIYLNKRGKGQRKKKKKKKRMGLLMVGIILKVDRIVTPRNHDSDGPQKLTNSFLFSLF